ncbi:hypothetical protein KSS87_014358, partial [Heliosperma pusillum]
KTALFRLVYKRTCEVAALAEAEVADDGAYDGDDGNAAMRRDPKQALQHGFQPETELVQV